MNDELLIELIQRFPVLYDASHKKYMDITFKSKIWKMISQEMNTHVALCKARWNNIRDNYRKSLKKSVNNSGLSSKKTKLYKYSDQLAFLKIELDEKETKGPTESQENEEEDQNHQSINDAVKSSDEDDETYLQTRSSSITSPRNTFADRARIIRRPTLRRAPSRQIMSSKQIEYLLKQKIESQSVPSVSHPVDAFLAGIAPTLKTLDSYNLNLAKSEIFATVQKYEIKMLLGQQSDFVSDHNVTPYSDIESNTSTTVFVPKMSPTEVYDEPSVEPEEK